MGQASIQPGVYDYPRLLFDWFPTLCEWAKVPLPTRQPVDGVSFAEVWQGKSRPDLNERPLFFHFPFYLEAYQVWGDDSRDDFFRTRPGSVVIKNGWKLYHYFEDGAYELYDLTNDPGERIDLANLAPDQKEELADMLNT